MNPRYIRTKNGRYEINNPYITYDPNYEPLMICVLKDTTQISRHPNHDVYRDNIHIITSKKPEYKLKLLLELNLLLL